MFSEPSEKSQNRQKDGWFFMAIFQISERFIYLVQGYQI